MKRRRFVARLVELAAASCIAGHGPFAYGRPAAVPTAADALRIAMLVERVLKLQAQAAQGLLAKRARHALAPALRDLQAAERALGVAASPAELHERTAILALLVAQLRARAARRLERDTAGEMAERAEEIEWEAERIAMLLRRPGDEPDAPVARALDGAYRAERIGRLLAWSRWGIEGSRHAEALATAKAALQSDLDALRASAATDAPGMRAELQVADNQAAFLFAASWRGERSSRGEAARELEFALKASDNAAESLERVAARWERAAR